MGFDKKGFGNDLVTELSPGGEIVSGLYTCAVCNTGSSAPICTECGFDNSCDYEKYSTLQKIPEKTPSVSRLKVQIKSLTQPSSEKEVDFLQHQKNGKHTKGICFEMGEGPFECENCLVKWDVHNLGDRIIKFCPFCGTEYKEKEPDGFSSLVDCFKYLKRKFGHTIFFEPEKILLYVSDYMPELKVEKRILKVALEADVYKQLLDDSGNIIDSNIKKAEAMLTNDYGLSEKWAGEAVDWLVKALDNVALDEIFNQMGIHPRDFLKEIFNIQPGDKFAFGYCEKWKVLDICKDHIVLFDEDCNERKRFNESRKPCIWENSSLRKWLNEDFINENFSSDEIKYIKYMKVITDDKETIDKVFLLCEQEVLKYNHLFEKIYETWLLRNSSPIKRTTNVMTYEKGKISHWGCVIDYEEYVKPIVCLSIKYFLDIYKKTNDKLNETNKK